MTKLVYIAGPYSANTQQEIEANITRAIGAAVWCAEHRIFYFCPHMNSAYMDKLSPNTPVLFYYAMDEEILSRCDAVLVLPGWENSEGTLAEIEYCKLHHVPYFYGREGLLNWYREEKP